MAKKKVAIVGCGGFAYQYALYLGASGQADVVALADPFPSQRAALKQRAEMGDGAKEYDDSEALLAAHSDLDGAVITTPHHLHASLAIPFLERGLSVAIEKPLAITKEDCERVMQAERRGGAKTLLGFVLRSTPFCRMMKELIDSGAIGRVVAVNMENQPGWGVSSIINRSGWRRFQETYGGVIVAEGSHDLDILNWFVGSRPVSVSSYGRRMVFHPNPELPETCPDCPVSQTCRYYIESEDQGGAHEGEDDSARYARSENYCVYNVYKTVIDNQVASLDYENGVMVSYMLNLNCGGPRTGRRFHVIGLKGRLWGDVHGEGQAVVHRFCNATGETTEHTREIDDSGHGGGNKAHVHELIRMMNEPDYRPEKDSMTGYLSAIAGLAAEASRLEGRRVDIVYGQDGLAEYR